MPNSSFLRIALVQMTAWPAFFDANRNWIEQPPSIGNQFGDKKLKPIISRIKEVYFDILREHIVSILAECVRRGVHFVVFPEYSIPCELLAVVKQHSGGMTVVGGSHRCTSNHFITYRELGWRDPVTVGCAVSPVFEDGRLIHMQEKLLASPAESGSTNPLVHGRNWKPLHFSGVKVGLFLCIDYLEALKDPVSAEFVRHHNYNDFDLIVIPANTGFLGLKHYESAQKLDTGGHHQIVALANVASGGGSGVYVPGAERDPDGYTKLGSLNENDEAVTIVDIDFQKTRPGGTATFTSCKSPTLVTVLPILRRARHDEFAFLSTLDKIQQIPAAFSESSWTSRIGEVAAECSTFDETNRCSWHHQLKIVRQLANGEYPNPAKVIETAVGYVGIDSPTIPVEQFDSWIGTQTFRRTKEGEISYLLGNDDGDLVRNLVRSLGEAVQVRTNANVQNNNNSVDGIVKRIRNLVEYRPFRHAEGRFYLPNLCLYAPLASSADSNAEETAESLKSEKTYWLRAIEIITGNPGDPGRVQAYNQTFVAMKLVTGEDAVNVTSNAIIGEWKTSLLLGNRGAGKSTLVNYIVTTKHRELQESLVCWFRSDAYKLYCIRMKEALPISLVEYQSIHAIWVSLISIGRGRDKGLETLAGFFRDQFSNPELWSGLNNSTKRQLQRLLHSAREKAYEHGANRELEPGDERAASTRFVVETYRLLCESIPSRAYREDLCLKLLRRFHACLSNKGYKVTHIIDSVDNLEVPLLSSMIPSYDDQPTPPCDHYEAVLKQVIDQLTRESDSYGYDSLLVCLRHGTWKDILALRNGDKNPVSANFPHEDAIYSSKLGPRAVRRVDLETAVKQIQLADFEQGSVAANVLEKKLRCAASPWSSEPEKLHFHSGIAKRCPIPMIGNDDPRQSVALVNQIVEIMLKGGLVKRLRRITGDERSGEFDLLLTHLFDGSIRSFVGNIIQASLYVSRMYRAANGFDTRSCDLANFLALRRYLIEEGSLLCGYPVLPEQHFNRRSGVRGDWCPALFYSRCDESGKHWPGLVTIRVLQTIEGINRTPEASHRSPQDWIRDIESLFGYPTASILDAVHRLLDYSLIEKGNVVQGTNGSFSPELRLTEKGRLVYALAFQDPATMYHMALYAPYSLDIWNNHGLADSRFFRIHSLSLSVRLTEREWWKALLPTLITFLRHLVHFDRREIVYMRRQSRTIAQKSFAVDPSALEEWYKLPSLEALYCSIAHGLAEPQSDKPKKSQMDAHRKRRVALEILEKTIPET